MGGGGTVELELKRAKHFQEETCSIGSSTCEICNTPQCGRV